MKNRKRRHFTHLERVRILRAHFDHGLPMRTLGVQQGIHPTVLHRWKRELLARLAEPPGNSPPTARALELRRRLRALDARLVRLHNELAGLHRRMHELEGDAPRILEAAWKGDSERLV